MPTTQVGALAKSFRANATGVGGAIHAAGRARRRLLAKKWRPDRTKLRKIIHHIQNTHQEVEAEVTEFIQSPHLLFQPMKMGITLTIPMLIPIFFMPTKLLLLYPILVIAWYLTCILFFATEISFRPPWHLKGNLRTGLPTKQRPAYWGRYVHDPMTDLGAPYECVEFLSPTIGTTLRGWFIPSKTALSHSNMLVFLHGAGQDRRAFLRHSKHFIAHGYSCLLVDFSEHGLSDNVTPSITRGTLFGAREQYDVIAAVDYLKKEKGAELVGVIGTSCGGSSAILAASIRPDLAACVIAENPFSRADALMIHHLHMLSKNYLSQNQHQTVRKFIFYLAGKLLMFRMGYLQSYGAVDAAKSLACPLLVLHSTEDDMVPYEHGVQVYEAAVNAHKGDATMASFSSYSDAAHCALYDRDENKWVEEALGFLSAGFARAKARTGKAN